MKLNRTIRELVTQIVARDVAAGVELARSLGYVMPKDFSVGVSFLEEGSRTRVRMRLDDATYDAIVRLPYLDGRQPLATTDSMWKAAMERIHTDAIVVAQVWIDKHPEARPRHESAVKALAILDALKADDVLFDRWMTSCHERAKHFTYR